MKKKISLISILFLFIAFILSGCTQLNNLEKMRGKYFINNANAPLFDTTNSYGRLINNELHLVIKKNPELKYYKSGILKNFEIKTIFKIRAVNGNSINFDIPENSGLKVVAQQFGASININIDLNLLFENPLSVLNDIYFGSKKDCYLSLCKSEMPLNAWYDFHQEIPDIYNLSGFEVKMEGFKEIEVDILNPGQYQNVYDTSKLLSGDFIELYSDFMLFSSTSSYGKFNPAWFIKNNTLITFVDPELAIFCSAVLTDKTLKIRIGDSSISYVLIYSIG